MGVDRRRITRTTARVVSRVYKQTLKGLSESVGVSANTVGGLARGQTQKVTFENAVRLHVALIEIQNLLTRDLEMLEDQLELWWEDIIAQGNGRKVERRLTFPSFGSPYVPESERRNAEKNL